MQWQPRGAILASRGLSSEPVGIQRRRKLRVAGYQHPTLMGYAMLFIQPGLENPAKA